MPPIVNITPRTLPGAGSPDRLGLTVDAADLLIDEERRRRQLAMQEEQAQLDRDLQRELQATEGEQALEQIGARGGVQEGLIRTEGDVFANVRNPAIMARELAVAGEQGRQRRETATTEAGLEADVVIPARTRGEERLIGARGEVERGLLDRRFEHQGALQANEQVLGANLEGELMDRRFDNEARLIAHEAVLDRNLGGDFGGFGGFGAGVDLDALERRERDPTPGRTRGGETSGGRSRTPPAEARGGGGAGRSGGLGASVRSLFQTPEQPRGGLGLMDAGLGAAGPGERADFDPELAGLPIEQHLGLIERLPPDMVADYLSELPPQARQAVRAAMGGR